MYLKINALEQKLEVVQGEPTLQHMQKEVGGWIEIVRPKGLPEGLLMIVDDEGLLKKKQYNPFASFLYRTQDHGHPIVGDVCIVAEVWGNDGPDIAPLTEKQRLFVEGLFNAFARTI